MTITTLKTWASTWGWHLKAVGDKAGMTLRQQFIPMDEALVLVALDFRGAACWFTMSSYSASASRQTCLVREFMQALAANAGLTLHIKLMHGRNSHHVISGL